MGRKKIEIRPLHDERNRNVTFLKRKAGLMKKAWELSVLCGADVSIVIFSAAGKAYEFSSSELDTEIDRYLDYEGVIERRRAPEFAAMAEAEEDDDEDDDEAGGSRRGSGVKPPGVTKSLKGKESFKSRMHTQAELAKLIARREKERDRDKHRSSRDKRGRDEYGKRVKPGGSAKRSALELAGDDSMSDGSLDSADDDEGVSGRRDDRDKRRRRARESATRSRHDQQSLAGLQYAMNLHTRPQNSLSPHDPFNASTPDSGNMPPPVGRLPADAYSFRVQHPSQLDYSRSHPHPHAQSSTQYSHSPLQTQTYPTPITPAYGAGQDRSSSLINYLSPLAGPGQANHNYNAHNGMDAGMQPIPGSNPAYGGSAAGGSNGTMLPGNMQWDPQLLARYAEFQLQQNHQRQQRALLEQQRQQLAELGIPVEDRSLLDQLFGNPQAQSGAHTGSSTNTPNTVSGGAGGGSSMDASMPLATPTSAPAGMIDGDMGDQSTGHSHNQPFEWPSVTAPKRETNEGFYQQIDALVDASRGADVGGGRMDDGLRGGDGRPNGAMGDEGGLGSDGKESRDGVVGGWNDDFAPFPSPASAGEIRVGR